MIKFLLAVLFTVQAFAQQNGWEDLPPSGGGSGSNASVSANGVSAPTSSTQVGGVNPSGNLQPFQVTSLGNLKVDIASSSLTPLPVKDTADSNDAGTASTVGQQISGIDETTGLSRIARMNGYGYLITTGESGYSTGSISATGTVPQFNNLDGSQVNHAVIQLSGTWSAGVQLQVSNDGAIWSAVPMQSVDSSLSNPVSTMTANGLYVGPTSGSFLIRLRVVSYVSGTIISIGTFNNSEYQNYNIPAATLANQTNGSQKNQLVDGSGSVVGPVTALSGVNYIPVVTASSATPGSAVPARSIEISGQDAGGLARNILVASDGTIQVNTGNPYINTTGTLTSAQAVTVQLAGQGTMYIQPSGTWTGSIVVTGSDDGTNFQTLFGLDTVTTDGQQQASIPSSGVNSGHTFAYSVAGFKSIKLTAGGGNTGTFAYGLYASRETTILDGNLGYLFTQSNTRDGSGVAITSSAMGTKQGLDTAAPDLYVTGQSAQTATVNNIITVTSGAAATDAFGYKSASVQVVSTGTAGTFIFEGSDDNSNFQAIPVYSQLVLTGTPTTAAITATVSQLIYTFPVPMRYIRLRIATTITGGSIQAFTKLSQSAWTPAVFQIAQATAANLNATVTGTITAVTTVGTVTNTTSIYTNADQASAAIITTTTGAAKVLAAGAAVSLNVAITAVSGTNPTYDLSIQSSIDGANWNTVYQMPRQTATGFYATPMLQLNGIQYRYIETIGGTTPSFTRTITSNRSNLPGNLYRNLVDRAIVPSTTNSTTASLFVEGYSSVGAIISLGAGGTAPVQIVIDGSDDNSNWVQGLASAYVYPSTIANISYGSEAYRYIRGRIVTGVASTTLNYMTIFASPIALVAAGKSSTPVVNNYGSTNITTAAYVQLVSSTSVQTTSVDVEQDTSGQTMILAVGPAGQERDVAYIQAGGGTQLPLLIPQGTRISYKALSGNATTGYVIINLLN